jgi:hypothetical protein
MNKLVLMLVLAVVCGNAMASACNEDIVKNVSPDGRFLMMLSGASYDVDVANYDIVKKWNEADNVQICNIAGNAAEIINKDEGSQKVSVKRIN